MRFGDKKERRLYVAPRVFILSFCIYHIYNRNLKMYSISHPVANVLCSTNVKIPQPTEHRADEFHPGISARSPLR